VHGIVTNHGGRIEASNAVAQVCGSTSFSSGGKARGGNAYALDSAVA